MKNKPEKKEPLKRKPLKLYWEEDNHADIADMSESPMNAREEIPFRERKRSKLPKDGD